jgi:hypothetical protein
MQTRSTSSIDARRCTTIFALLLAFAVQNCKDEPTRVVETDCRPNQFRLCDAECGRGVEQCIEPGVWGGCTCAVLDAAIPDARSIGDASDGATDAPPEAGDGGDAADGASDAETGDSDPEDSDPTEAASG